MKVRRAIQSTNVVQREFSFCSVARQPYANLVVVREHAAKSGTVNHGAIDAKTDHGLTANVVLLYDIPFQYLMSL